jgi:hypothetical protein
MTTQPLRRHLVAAALLAGLGAAATAQVAAPAAPAASASASGNAPHGRFDPARMAERVNRHLAELKQKLQLSASQEPAWTSFSNAMQPGARTTRPDREAIARMSTPDRIDHMRALRERRNAEMDRRGDAAKAFYAQLSAEQKKTFDAETVRLFHRGGKHHRQHG